ncbi:Response regulator receiver domain-containing protein [Fontimonas thermophila]|uniref:Response regulator receiver domain-containing protein n=1 Tax=Fontimonas thermophila TaxID=1076937 RepID=A0A1I2HAL5_9GAMM|nr:response regulator [Fontimonas thermophila]SFF26702.1 Response regulator receiver domain-containing protein [Fontimonas thermophila]
MSQHPPKARVLFVDDEPRVLTTMRMLFRNQYDVLTADSGQAALELLKTQAVDVIVSDQRMPGMTGIEMLRAARELNPAAMRILLTGYSDLNAIIGSINEGEIFRFINKPWSNDDLTATVARAVAAARASAAAAQAGDGSAPIGPPPGVLVLDDDPQVPARIQTILGADFRVVAARSMEEAVNLLEKERIGVIISDTRVADSPVLGLISTLKQHHPELVSVILTERADAGTAIELINQGQIYRFITKPIHDSQCKITVSSALRQHHRLAQSPELHQRYEVAAPKAQPAAAESPQAKLMDRIRTLRTVVKRWV